MPQFFKSILAGCFLLLLTGCVFEKPALRQPRSIQPEVTIQALPQSAQPTEAPPAPKAPTPRAIASLELSKQAQSLIEAGKPDEAIRYLERAVNLHPGSGENYYYLAEAWLLKGNYSQAVEYNTLAASHFKDEPEWIKRITSQKKLINRISKN